MVFPISVMEQIIYLVTDEMFHSTLLQLIEENKKHLLPHKIFVPLHS